MKPKHIALYKDIMNSVSKMSKCSRKKVGALVVSPDDENIIAYGWNGRPRNAKGDDCCEDDNVTKPDVIHAEMNAIAKVARSGGATDNCTLFVTMCPCPNCALLIIQSGIKTVYYQEQYRMSTGLDILTDAGVQVIQLKE